MAKYEVELTGPNIDEANDHDASFIRRILQIELETLGWDIKVAVKQLTVSVTVSDEAR